MREETLKGLDSERFEFQNWPVYKAAVRFGKSAQELSVSLSKTGNRQLVDQLRRASQSIPLNIAEGSGRHTTKDKMNFFRVARGSVFECVAIIDLSHDMGLVDFETKSQLEISLSQLGKMLSGFIKCLENFKEKRAE